MLYSFNEIHISNLTLNLHELIPVAQILTINFLDREGFGLEN